MPPTSSLLSALLLGLALLVAPPQVSSQFTIYADCPTGFEGYAICTEFGQCQGQCCFSTGFCTGSSNNNCLDAGPYFPPTLGTSMDNHPDPSDGCLCNTGPYTSPLNSSVVKSVCDPLTTSFCWGIITCDPALPSSSCNQQRTCVVRVAFACANSIDGIRLNMYISSPPVHDRVPGNPRRALGTFASTMA